MTPEQASSFIRESSPAVIEAINGFARETFLTLGGRLGSGMGLLLEGLWGYQTNAALAGKGIEIAWLADDHYNDFACVHEDADWDPVTRTGELFRIEAKSMNLGADESKAHFAELASHIGENDLILVMTWGWSSDETGRRVWPKIEEALIERARPIARLRDEMHLARGGTFVDRADCPDGCEPRSCRHHGEPLNASRKRERISGPENCRPSSRVSFAANYGGLFRMIGTGNQRAKEKLIKLRESDEAIDRYVAFVNRSRGRLEI